MNQDSWFSLLCHSKTMVKYMSGKEEGIPTQYCGSIRKEGEEKINGC